MRQFGKVSRQQSGKKLQVVSDIRGVTADFISQDLPAMKFLRNLRFDDDNKLA
jgi:hypothetical protein